MERLINKLGLLLLLVVIMGSCSEDELLTPKPLSFYTPSNVFNSEDGFQAALVTMREAHTEPFTTQYKHMLSEWATSEAGLFGFMFDLTDISPFFSRSYSIIPFFADAYGYIKDANVVINRIDDIEWSNEQEKNAVLAEALWHRAYWYYWLVHSYGDVPFVSQEVQGAKLDYYTHSRKTILDKLQTDLEFAVPFLPETTVPGAITRGAGNHLLSKVYLADLEFDKAIAAADEVINGPYALMTQRFGQDADDPDFNVIWDLHRPDNKNIPQNTETIFAIVDRFEAPTGAQTSGLYTMRNYNSAWYQGAVRDSEGQQGTIDAGPQYALLGRGNPDLVSSSWIFYDLWNENGNNWRTTPDKRRSDVNWIDKHEIYYNNPNSVDFGEPVRSEWIASPDDSIFMIFPMAIYKTYAPQQNPSARPVGGNGDWYVYRLAGTYLIRAEAHFWNGNLAAAADDINRVRERAGAPLITAGEVTIDLIFDERARELFFESPRHAELVRASYIMAELNINGYSLANFSQNNYWYDRVYNLNEFFEMNASKAGFTADVSPHLVLWPIDNNIINANTGGHINQNEGYVGAENNIPPLETIDEEQQ